MIFRGPVAFVFALLVLCAACGVTETVSRDPLGRAFLIRSPQPNEEDITNLVQREGLRTIVCLRKADPDAAWYQEEERCIQALGLRWVILPVSSRRAPQTALLERFLEVMDSEAAAPVLIHCQGGIHRTGVMVAAWRILREAWSPERAVEEMEERGFNWGVTDRSAMKDWLMGLKPGLGGKGRKIEKNLEENP